MQIQLDEYFRKKRISKIALDRTFTPLLDYILNNKVNSIHQIHQKVAPHNFSQLYEPQTSKLTLSVFPSNFTEIKKHISKTEVTIRTKYKQLANPKFQYERLHSFESVKRTANNSLKASDISNSLLKKKHSQMDHNNLKVIQISMHPDRRRVSLFQNFCQQIQRKNQNNLSVKSKWTNYKKRRGRNFQLVGNQQAQKYYEDQQLQSQNSIDCSWLKTKNKLIKYKPNIKRVVYKQQRMHT